MNSAPKAAPKFRLYFLSLNDMYDAKNVADKIIDKNTILNAYFFISVSY